MSEVARKLDHIDWKLLEILNKILKPIFEATSIISGSKYSTIGTGYFVIMQIRDFLEDTTTLDNNNYDIEFHLKNMLLQQIGKYFFEKQEQLDLLKSFAYFDPIGFGCLSRRERRSIEVNILQTQDQYIVQNDGEEESEQTQSNTNTQQKALQSSTSSISKFLSSIGKKNSISSSNTKSTKNSTLNEELVLYRSLAQKEFNLVVYDDHEPDVIQFWYEHRSDFKMLSKIAKYHIICPATSVPSESAFSMATYLLRKQRSRLTPNNLCYSMFLKDKLDDDDNVDM